MDNAGIIYRQLALCARDIAVEGIAKDRKNDQQGYKFRGIDDVYNAIAPILSKHGVIIVPTFSDREMIEGQSKNGGRMVYVTVRGTFTAFAEDGSSVVAVTFGEAMDSADKATNKAMSAAYKYAAFQLLCIPTEGDNDADANTPAMAPKAKAPPKPSLPPQQGQNTAERVGEMYARIDAIQSRPELNQWYKKHEAEIKALPKGPFDAVMATLSARKNDLPEYTRVADRDGPPTGGER